jgi:hypothetical protein
MNKELVTKLIKAVNEIEKKGTTPKTSFIHLNDEYIQQLADKQEISFDEMIKVLKKNFKNDE